MDENELFNSGSDSGRKIPTISTPPTTPPPNADNKKNVNYNTNYNTNYYKNNRKGCLFWGLIALGIFITVNGFIFFGIVSMFASDSSYEEVINQDYVEVLRIEGTIARGNVNSYGMPVGYQHDWMLGRIEELKSDAYNKGIILYINSGGGAAYESDEMYNALKKYKEQTGRRVYAYYADTAASGALYISLAADGIYSNRMTTTGSIGVKMTTYNTKELMDKIGIKEVTIRSGSNKNMLSPTEDVTQEQLDIMQAIIDESYQYFVEALSESRNIPMETAYSIADGRVYSPKQALELGLIDDIMDYSDFLDMMYDTVEFSGCYFNESTYMNNSLLGILFSKMPEGSKEFSEAELLKYLLEKSDTISPEFQ